MRENKMRVKYKDVENFIYRYEEKNIKECILSRYKLSLEGKNKI